MTTTTLAKIAHAGCGPFWVESYAEHRVGRCPFCGLALALIIARGDGA